MKKINLKYLLAAIGILIFIHFSISGCTRKKDDPKLSIFHSSEKDDVKTWDSANAYDSVSLSLLPSIVETLYQYSYLSDGYKIEPLLAAEMPKYSQDRLTLTIPIKRGIRYQNDPCFKESQGNGRELTAQDFVYGIKRLALPSLQSNGWWVVDHRIRGINEFHDKLAKAEKKEEIKRIFEEEVEGLKALDPYTLQIKLIRPVPQMLYLLAMTFTAPVPKEAIQVYADSQGNLLEHPVGTGPFILTRWDRNHEIVLDRNPNFRGEHYPSSSWIEFERMGLLADAGKPMPFIDRITIEIIKESQPQWLNFMKGNIDLIPLPKDNFNQVVTNQVNLNPNFVKKGIHLSIESGVVVRFITFNMQDQLLGSNKYLRQALSSALNRDQWISLFTSGTGRKMVNAVPPGIADRPSTEEIKYDFNLVRAKELLKKAGYPDGKGLPILKFDLRGASTVDRQLGDFITQQFGQIGVKIEPVPNTFPAFLEKSKQGNLQISYGGWAMDYPDAENIYQLLYGPNRTPGPDDSNFDNAEFNKLFEQIEVMESGPKRKALIQKMDDILQEECPWALGYYETSYILSQPWLLNFRGSELISNKPKYYRINKDIRTRYLGQ